MLAHYHPAIKGMAMADILISGVHFVLRIPSFAEDHGYWLRNCGNRDSPASQFDLMQICLCSEAVFCIFDYEQRQIWYVFL